MSEVISTVETSGENTGGGSRKMIISTGCDQECHHLHHQFPDGLRVLLIDDNVVSLSVISALLTTCHYQVTAKSNPVEALALLKEQKGDNKFDIVLTDVEMPGIDGFGMLAAGLELDIPVVLMSVTDNKDVIMKGIRQGAYDFLVKPISEKEVKYIWRHVYRKAYSFMSSSDDDHSRKMSAVISDDVGPVDCCYLDDTAGFVGSSLEDDEIFTLLDHHHHQETNSNNNKDADDNHNNKGSKNNDGDNNGGKKRRRLKWTEDLHDKFVVAVETLGGINKAVPKKILEVMGSPDISRQMIASHLQKFRKANNKKLKKNQLLLEPNNKVTTNTNIIKVVNCPAVPVSNMLGVGPTTYPNRMPTPHHQRQMINNNNWMPAATHTISDYQTLMSWGSCNNNNNIPMMNNNSMSLPGTEFLLHNNFLPEYHHLQEPIMIDQVGELLSMSHDIGATAPNVDSFTMSYGHDDLSAIIAGFQHTS